VLAYLLFVQHKKTLVWPRLHVLCYCLLPRLHVCRLSLPSWLSTYCLLMFVASSTCLSFIVAIIDVIGLFYIWFCQGGQEIAAVSSCPSLLVLLIRFRFYHSLPGKLSHSTLLIDRYHFCMIDWSIDWSIDRSLFWFSRQIVRLCTLSFLLLSSCCHCFCFRIHRCFCSWCALLKWGWVLHRLTGVAQSILIDHCCHCQIAAVAFPKTSTIGWY
jgi:hypothetical protein